MRPESRTYLTSRNPGRKWTGHRRWLKAGFARLGCMDEPRKKSRFRFSLRTFIALAIFSTPCIALVAAKRQISELESEVRSLRRSPIDLLRIASVFEQNKDVGTNHYIPTKVTYIRNRDEFEVKVMQYIGGERKLLRTIRLSRQKNAYVGVLPEFKQTGPTRYVSIRGGNTKTLSISLNEPTRSDLVPGWRQNEESISREKRPPDKLESLLLLEE